MDLVFRDLKLHRAMAWALPDNTASIRFLERVGFVYEGICHDYMMLNEAAAFLLNGRNGFSTRTKVSKSFVFAIPMAAP